jgi:hypothetical protein
MVKDIKGQLRFGFEGDVFQDTGSLATVTVIGRLLGQIQLAVDDSCRCAMNQRGIHAGLAIIALAEAAAPLAGYADRLLSIFWAGSFHPEEGHYRGSLPKGYRRPVPPDPSPGGAPRENAT